MPRPGLIVGLGGTGQWVLTWLKRDLLLSNDGVMPHNVQLLEIDTCTHLEAKVSHISVSGKKEEVAEVRDVMLDKSEYVYIGGDVHEFAKQIRERQNREQEQVSPWFHASQWLSTQSPRTFILDEGAGRLRQFGRLAIFKDMQSAETNSKIWRAVHTAIEGLRSTITERRSLEIIVVGSFAGGTGSGLFIDVALILRLLAQQLGVHHILRGIFALPSVFMTAPDAEMKARAFSAWRELNRFMVVDPDFPMPEIRYTPNNPNFRIQPNQRLFDACYLIDGKRRGWSITQEPKDGVFPMMAEVLGAILDEQVGTAYTQWVFTNLAPEYAKRPETPMYSAVGAYTIQVPAYFVQECSVYEYSKQLLLRLLVPKREPDTEERLVAAGAERHLALAAPDRNQEDRGFAGHTRSLTLLSNTAAYGTRTARPTLYHSQIAEIIRMASDQNSRQSIIDSLARGGTVQTNWVAYFPNFGDSPTFETIQRLVNEQMAYNIVQQYRRRESEREEEARARFKKIPEDLRARLGGVMPSGEEIEDFYGTCGDALQECKRVQLIVFRQVIQLRLLDILNGHTNDALIAKSGKLGYAWDYFDGLIGELEIFWGLLAEVKKRREEIKPEIRLAGLSKKAQDFLNATAGKKIFWFWEHPNVKGAEMEYLNAQQRLLEIRREDILLYYVVETAREMRVICEQVRDALQRWIWHLATGDGASRLPGLWDVLRDGEQQLINAHSYDNASPKFKQLIADAVLPITEEDIQQALGLWEWNVAFADERFSLQVHILPQAAEETVSELLDPMQGVTSELRQQIGQENANALLDLARRRFRNVTKSTTAATEIKREYPDPRRFAENITTNAEPFFDGIGVGCVKKSKFISILTDENDTYFIGSDGLEGYLRTLHNLDRAIRNDTFCIQVVSSESPHKMTFFCTDELYPYYAYKAWGECLEAYKHHIYGIYNELSPVLMHNFSAEIEAIRVERQMTRELGLEYHLLHPRVVMLLEDRKRLEQCIYLIMLNIITESPPTTSPYRWQLTWKRKNKDETLWLTKGWIERPEEPTLLIAMHGYILLKHSQEPRYLTYGIDTDFAETLIKQELDILGRSGSRELLVEHLNSDRGLVKHFRQICYDYVDGKPTQVRYQDYADMGMVIELFLKEELRKLDREYPEELDETESIYEQPHREIEYEKPELEDIEQPELLKTPLPIWQLVLTTSAVEAIVGQIIRLQVILRPGLSGINTFKLPENAHEIHCFLEADGLQIQDTEVMSIPLPPQTDQSPITFTLQSHLCGERPYTIELFAEDPQSGKMHIFKTSGQITVSPPTIYEGPSPTLTPLEIQVAAHPDFTLRAITEFPDGKDSPRYVSYYLASRLPGLGRGEKWVGRIALSVSNIAQMRALLNQTLYAGSSAQPQDVSMRMLSLGIHFFQRLFPTGETALFHEALRKAAGRLHTWLIVEDGVTWLPWELLAHDWRGTGQVQFLAEQFRVSRWIAGLGPKPYSEVPLGEIALAHYRPQEADPEMKDELVEGWQHLLAAHNAFGILQVVKPETPVYGLHLLRYLDPSAEGRSIVARTHTGEAVEGVLENELHRAKLDIHLKRPVVTLGMLAETDQASQTPFEEWLLPERALPFVRAGASAVAGPWWPTSETADRIFWPAFYDLLMRRVPLGEVVWRARMSVKAVLSQSPDWLAYTLFGDPLAEAYLPETSEGYTVLECLSQDAPLIVGKPYRFRASIHSRPPVWYQDRLVDVEALPQDPRVLFLAPGILDEIPDPVKMEPIGRTMVQATIELTPQEEGQMTLIARLFNGDERLQVLQLQLKVGREKG